MAGWARFFFLANATCMTNVYAASVALVAEQLSGFRVTIIDYSLPGGAHCDCGHPSDMNHLEMARAALPVIKRVTGW